MPAYDNVPKTETSPPTRNNPVRPMKSIFAPQLWTPTLPLDRTANSDQRVLRSLTAPRIKNAVVVAIYCLLIASTHAANWYVDSNALTGLKNGTSWANAWTSFSSIAWGGNGVKAGDTLYISGGTSSKSYSGTLFVNASGTASARIYIKPGQDSGHNGLVIINGGISLSHSYVTIDGEYQGKRHFILPGTGINGSGSVDPVIRYLEISNVSLGIAMVYGRGGEFAYNKITGITKDAAIRMNARNDGVAQYDQTLIHHNEIQVNGQVNNGNGPDGIQTGWGVSFYNNLIYSSVGRVTGGEHQDLIQTYGTRYHKIYNNEFINSGDAMVGVSFTGGTGSNIRIWNNVFRMTTANMGTDGHSLLWPPESDHFVDGHSYRQ